MNIIKVDKLWFRDKNGILQASSVRSDHDADWAEVATIPVEDFKELQHEFRAATERFRLATVKGFRPPSGEIYILVPQPCLDADVRDVTPPVQDGGRASYRVQCFAEVKNP